MFYDDPIITLTNISKVYKLYDKPIDRLIQMFPWNQNKRLYKEYNALKDINLSIKKGEVIGIVGKNGAGKSTLLQIVCNTLQPSSGKKLVKGKIAALLELGSGFNPEFSGRENVYMAAAIAGLSKEEIDLKYDDILEFSGIDEYINNPVKTYSSGMMVRLAFSVATSIEPEILVIDEALSVGDGSFAKKSFDRIMQLKKNGATILFCSHNLYQVEALCDKVLWINKGKIESSGSAQETIKSYQNYLDELESKAKVKEKVKNDAIPTISGAKIKNIDVYSDDGQQGNLKITSSQNNVTIDVTFKSDLSIPIPSVGVLITDENLKNITSTISIHDNILLKRDNDGISQVKLIFPKISLMKGNYLLHIFLMCENAIHIYENVQYCTIVVSQKHSEPGVVFLPRKWKNV